jgi:hypothetical protein
VTLLAAFILATSAHAQTVITASTCDPIDFTNAVSKGGLITFASDCTIAGWAFVGTNTTIDGTGHKVILDGTGIRSLLDVRNATLTLNHITVQNSHGSAISATSANLIVMNCAFLNNIAIEGAGGGSGGAIKSDRSPLTVVNSTFSGNQAAERLGGSGSAIFVTATTANIISSTFAGNSTNGVGAVFIENSTVTLTNTILANNTGGSCFYQTGFHDGGYNLSDDATCKFTAGSSKNSDPSINLGTLTNGVIPPNPGSDAIGDIPAGVNGCASTVTTDQIGQLRPGSLNAQCTVGAYEVVAPVSATITNCADDTQLQNAVSAGGRVVFACSGDIPLSKTLNITQNTALDATGQIVILDGHKSVRVLDVNPNEVSSGPALTLNALNIANGSAVQGSGIYINSNSNAVVTNSTFTGNGTIYGGAGIYTNLYTNLIVTGSTFWGNTASGDGAAIYMQSRSIVTNSTFANNTATAGPGGAISSNQGNLSLLNDTFSGNSASIGGALYNHSTGDQTTLQNSLFVNNGGGNCDSLNSSFTDSGYNLADDATCQFTSLTSTANNKNANVGTLSNNGGPAQTVPLLAGSAAMDAIPMLVSGCGATLLTDQRGVLRPQGAACDIGAFENALNQVQVTFNTSTPGLAFSAGASSYAGQQILTLPVGTQLTVWTRSPQTTSGTQYSFANWSDGGAEAHIITIPGSNTTYTANFDTSYLLTTAVNPIGAGAVTPNSGTYYPAGTSVNLTASASSGYVFTGWTGAVNSQSNPLHVTMNSPVTETANFAAAVQVTVGTSLGGLSFSVDGTTYSSPLTLTWAIGSLHTIATTTPQTLSGTQYGFVRWSDGGAISHSVTASAGTTSYTAAFAPLATFTITPNPPNETISRGHIAAFILTLKSVNGFSGNVKLSCSGGPAGSYCTNFPMTVPVKSTAYAVSGIFFPKNTMPGVYTITFTGVSGVVTTAASAKFTVLK